MTPKRDGNNKKSGQKLGETDTSQEIQVARPGIFLSRICKVFGVWT